MVHALDASLKGHRRVKIRTNDTDVVVLAISVVNTLSVDEMWITFGLGKHVYNLAAHSIAISLGQDKASVLPMFHILRGCGTVSFFSGQGKKTAWDTWTVFPELTPVLRSLKSSPAKIADDSRMLLKGSWFCYMIEQAALLKSMKRVKNCFKKSHRTSTTFHPLEQCLCNIQRELCFKEDMCGDGHF